MISDFWAWVLILGCCVIGCCFGWLTDCWWQRRPKPHRHEWNEWEQIKVTVYSDLPGEQLTPVTMQARTCNTCGYMVRKGL